MSLQSAEKFLKALLKENGVKYPKGHDLHTLAVLARPFVTLSSAPLDAATCDAGVRYGETPSSLTQAIVAHHASLCVCAAVAGALGCVRV